MTSVLASSGFGQVVGVSTGSRYLSPEVGDHAGGEARTHVQSRATSHQACGLLVRRPQDQALPLKSAFGLPGDAGQLASSSGNFPPGAKAAVTIRTTRETPTRVRAGVQSPPPSERALNRGSTGSSTRARRVASGRDSGGIVSSDHEGEFDDVLGRAPGAGVATSSFGGGGGERGSSPRSRLSRSVRGGGGSRVSRSSTTSSRATNRTAGRSSSSRSLRKVEVVNGAAVLEDFEDLLFNQPADVTATTTTRRPGKDDADNDDDAVVAESLGKAGARGRAGVGLSLRQQQQQQQRQQQEQQEQQQQQERQEQRRQQQQDRLRNAFEAEHDEVAAGLLSASQRRLPTPPTPAEEEELALEHEFELWSRETDGSELLFASSSSRGGSGGAGARVSNGGGGRKNASAAPLTDHGERSSRAAEGSHSNTASIVADKGGQGVEARAGLSSAGPVVGASGRKRSSSGRARGAAAFDESGASSGGRASEPSSSLPRSLQGGSSIPGSSSSSSLPRRSRSSAGSGPPPRASLAAGLAALAGLGVGLVEKSEVKEEAERAAVLVTGAIIVDAAEASVPVTAAAVGVEIGTGLQQTGSKSKPERELETETESEAEMEMEMERELGAQSDEERQVSLMRVAGRGGRRVLELVAAWDALIPRLPREVVRSSGAQLLLAALKLAVPALQDAPPGEGGRRMLQRALAIATTLADVKMDAETIAAGIVREAVDAGVVSRAAVERQLGAALGRLVHDARRVARAPARAEALDDASAQAVREYCLGYHDARALVAELAARLDTLRHMGALPRWRQQILALETLQVWAPLAHAVGTGSAMWELEDTAFRVLLPASYASMEAWLRSLWQEADPVGRSRAQLEAALLADPVMRQLADDVQVSGRRKSLFSTMRKLLRDGRTRHEVYDLLGLRIVITPKKSAPPPGAPLEPEAPAVGVTAGAGTIAAAAVVAGAAGAGAAAAGAAVCYRAREVAASLWPEVAGRSKDYIAKPKANGYQSLHLALRIDAEQQAPPVEVQIRTTDMDATAVHGAASHGAYKGGVADPQQVQALKAIVQAAATLAGAAVEAPPAGVYGGGAGGSATVEVEAEVSEAAPAWSSSKSKAARGVRVGTGGEGEGEIAVDIYGDVSKASGTWRAGASTVTGTKPGVVVSISSDAGVGEEVEETDSEDGGADVDHIFQLFDRNGDGQISMEEVYVVLGELEGGGGGEAPHLLLNLSPSQAQPGFSGLPDAAAGEGLAEGGSAGAGSWERRARGGDVAAASTTAAASVAEGMGSTARRLNRTLPVSESGNGSADVFGEGGLEGDASAAAVGEGEEERRRRQRARDGDAAELMAVLDLNTDGTVSASEFAEFRRQIRLLRNIQGVDRQYNQDLGSCLQDNTPPVLSREHEAEFVSSSSNSDSRSASSWAAEAESPAAAGGGAAAVLELPQATQLLPPGRPRPEDAPAAAAAVLADASTRPVAPALAPAPAAHAPAPPLRVEGRVGSTSTRKLGVINKPVRGRGTAASAGGGAGTLTHETQAQESPTLNPPETLSSQVTSADGLRPIPPSRRVLPEMGAAAEVPDPAQDVRAGPASRKEVERLLKQVRGLISGLDTAVRWDAPGHRAGPGASDDAGARNVSQARSILQQLAAQGGGSNPNVWSHFARLERKLGNHGQARIFYERSVQAYRSQVAAGGAISPQEDAVGVTEEGPGQARVQVQARYGETYLKTMQDWATLEAEEGYPHSARQLLLESIRAARQEEAAMGPNAAGLAAKGLHVWAMLEQQEGNWAKARDLLARAEALQPGNAVVLHARALLEARAHNWEPARAFFQKAADAAPRDAVIWQAWGVFEARAFRPERMRVLFQKALEINPTSLHTLQAWAHQEALLGTAAGRARARQLYTQCTELHPHSTFAWQAWAVMEHKAGKAGVARSLFQRCLQVAPRSVPALQALANLEREEGNLLDARSLLEKALQHEPQNAPALMQAAKVEEELGNGKEAYRLYVRAALVDKKVARLKRRTFESRRDAPPTVVPRQRGASATTPAATAVATAGRVALRQATRPAEKRRGQVAASPARRGRVVGVHRRAPEAPAAGAREWRAPVNGSRAERPAHLSTIPEASKAQEEELLQSSPALAREHPAGVGDWEAAMHAARRPLSGSATARSNSSSAGVNRFKSKHRPMSSVAVRDGASASVSGEGALLSHAEGAGVARGVVARRVVNGAPKPGGMPLATRVAAGTGKPGSSLPEERIGARAASLVEFAVAAGGDVGSGSGNQSEGGAGSASGVVDMGAELAMPGADEERPVRTFWRVNHRPAPGAQKKGQRHTKAVVAPALSSPHLGEGSVVGGCSVEQSVGPGWRRLAASAAREAEL